MHFLSLGADGAKKLKNLTLQVYLKRTLMIIMVVTSSAEAEWNNMLHI